jgi:hypothetical protein
VLQCNLCPPQGNRFEVTYDFIGIELMHAHLLEEHGITQPR